MSYTNEIKTIIRREMNRYFEAEKIRIMNLNEFDFTTMWGMQTVRHYSAKVSYYGYDRESGLGRHTKVVTIQYAPMIDTMINFDW